MALRGIAAILDEPARKLLQHSTQHQTDYQQLLRNISLLAQHAKNLPITHDETIAGEETIGGANVSFDDHFITNTNVNYTTVNLSWVWVVVAVALVVLLFVLCVKMGWIGPPSLKEDDLVALKTFNDTYRMVQLELEEDVLGHEPQSFWMIGERQIATSPAVEWNELFPSALRGFLIQLAKKIDEQMFHFQCRVWIDKGPFMEHLPVVLVAQEWRRWAMEMLQHNLSPKPEIKVDLLRRLDWIETIRDLSLNGVTNLRKTPYWDDSDELSLLVVLRRDIAGELRRYADNWDLLELQQGFAGTAGEVTAYITQELRESVRFLERIYTYDELRLHSMKADSKRWFTPIEQELLELQKNANIWDEKFPESFRDQFEDEAGFEAWFKSHTKGRPTSYKDVVAENPVLSDFERSRVQKYLSSYGHWRYGLSTQQELVRMMESSVVLLDQLYVLLDAVLLMMSLQNFASLGGTNFFLAGVVSVDHAKGVMNFIDETVREVKLHVCRIGDIAQGGWSNMRRGRKTSWFSSPGPLDNMRLAMSNEDNVEQIAANASGMIRYLKAHITNCRIVDGDQEEKTLSKEIEYFKRFWEALSRVHNIDEKGEGRPIRYI